MGLQVQGSGSNRSGLGVSHLCTPRLTFSPYLEGNLKDYTHFRHQSSYSFSSSLSLLSFILSFSSVIFSGRKINSTSGIFPGSSLPLLLFQCHGMNSMMLPLVLGSFYPYFLFLFLLLSSHLHGLWGNSLLHMILQCHFLSPLFLYFLQGLLILCYRERVFLRCILSHTQDIWHLLLGYLSLSLPVL